ncbi:MAG: AAA family ATPase [Chitinivibrionales bacterium]|nr:AAA family ATPase [Chitinivibrionales bacterium]
MKEVWLCGVHPTKRGRPLSEIIYSHPLWPLCILSSFYYARFSESFCLNDYLSGLNQSQKKAVFHTRGPLLVLAGAGSGKTRVLITRIARLLNRKVCKPSQVLAVTFTNKAAREMKERIAKTVSPQAASSMTVSTIHSLGARILRNDGAAVGINRNFSILSDYERKATIKGVMRSMGKGMKNESHDTHAIAISLAKNASLDPEDYRKLDEAGAKTGRIYTAYRRVLMHRNSVDFDDLLLLPLRLFENNPVILKEYQQKYVYVSIDEFQDTNAVQMKLMKLLAAPQNNILAVGDDDQSIYSWRGAVIDNILNFSRAFKGCKKVVLDTNYRSTAQILNASLAVASKNPRRIEKKIVASSGDGEKITHYRGDDEEDEARWIAETIKSHAAGRQFRFGDHALLFRTNAMMRRFEEALRMENVPYVTIGAASFFDRKEIRDVLAYMRFFANQDDEFSLLRVLKVPDKGITRATLRELDSFASGKRSSLYDAICGHEQCMTIGDAQKKKLAGFVDFCRRYHTLFARGNCAVVLRTLLQESGYLEFLEKASGPNGAGRERIENVYEIIHGLETFEKKSRKKDAVLIDYLQELCCAAGEDRTESAADTQNRVKLMTFHKAKGLEFPLVFLPGLDNSTMPSSRSVEEGRIDEERRLFYVGMTRAQKRLILTYPAAKVHRTRMTQVTPSQFLHEIPSEYLDGALGEREKENYQEYVSDFFAEMKSRFGASGE